MSFFDIVLIFILFCFALFGFWVGIIHAFGAAVGSLLGVFVAARWYAPFAGWLMHFTGWSQNFSRVLAFIIIFIVVNRLVGFLFYLIDRLLSILTRLPFLNGLNRLLGMLFGLFEGLVVIGVSIFFISRFPLNPQFMASLSASQVAPMCVRITAVLQPLIPQAIRALQNYLQNLIP